MGRKGEEKADKNGGEAQNSEMLEIPNLTLSGKTLACKVGNDGEKRGGKADKMTVKVQNIEMLGITNLQIEKQALT